MLSFAKQGIARFEPDHKLLEAADSGTQAGFRGLLSGELLRQLAKVGGVERHR
jgi:hypothetical protein